MTDTPEIHDSALFPGPGRRPRPLALSASRAGDFRQCPLLYRLRAIDRLPEPKSRPMVLGNVVHSVLEDLYALPQPERAPERAAELVPSRVDEMYREVPGVEEVVPLHEKEAFLSEVVALVSGLYAVEDPQRFSPDSLEKYLVTATDVGTPLHGFLDRVDIAPGGEVRVVDYKTGKPPRPQYAEQAMFQMKFYALMYHRVHGVLPRQLKLIYLRDSSWLTYEPDAVDLESIEQTLDAMWAEIETAGRAGDFRPRKSRLCSWCAHQAVCPAFGGTPPPYPGWPGTRTVN